MMQWIENELRNYIYILKDRRPLVKQKRYVIRYRKLIRKTYLLFYLTTHTILDKLLLS